MKINAAIDPKQAANSLLKILVLVAIKLKGGKIQDIKKSIGDTNKAGAVFFLSKLDTNVDLFEDMYDNILKSGTQLKPMVEAFTKDFKKVINSTRLKHNMDNLSIDSKQVLEPLLTLLSNPDSENALSNLNKKIRLLKDNDVTNAFANTFNQSKGVENAPKADTEDAGLTSKLLAIDKEIKSIVTGLTGNKNSYVIPGDVKREAKANPQKANLIVRYDQLRKDLNNLKLNEVRSIVSQKGTNGHISAADLAKELKSRGLDKVIVVHSNLAASPEIYYNSEAQICDSKGRVADRQGWDHGADIRVNPNYNGKNYLFQVITTDDNGEVHKNNIPTKERVAEKKTENFDKIRDTLENNLDGIKTAWRSHMKGNPESQQTVFANIAEYCYWTASRIGSKEGMTDGERTYGASNFLVQHVKLPKNATNASRLEISYPVKSSNTNRDFVLNSSADLPGEGDSAAVKNLIKFIIAKCKNKKPTDVVFSVNNERIDSGNLNSYLRNTLKSSLTAKSFRTLRGTELASKLLEQVFEEVQRRKADAAKNKKVLPAKDVLELFNAAMQHVGSLLGHVRRNTAGEEITTANTAIKSYVDPNIMLKWWKSVAYSPPGSVVNAARAAGIEI